jgi:WD40 repeat protein
MADVFISYSRRDGDFVRELHAFLTGCGKDVWVDWEDIPPASDWAQDIDDNIDSAESFVFVISGSSLGSQYALDELRHAGKRGKRIVPIACDGADPDQAPQGLRQLNWIWCRPDDDREEAFAKVLDALETDLAWSAAHTRLLVRAVEWDAERDRSLLMRGRDLEEAEQRLAANAGKAPVVTELQREYLLASRRASARRQRIILACVSLALLVSVVLGAIALLQRNEAIERAEIARSQALAAQATAALDTDQTRALADAVGAMETHRTPEARLALRRAILANPIAYAVDARAKPEVDTSSSIDALAFGDGGRSLIGLTPDGVVHVWRSEAGRAAITGSGATMFAERGGLLVTARSREARVLDLGTGAVLNTLRVPGRRVVGVGFSRGSPRVAVAAGGRVVLRGVPAGHAVALALRAGHGGHVLFAASGDRVVSFGSGTRTRVWDARTGRQLATLPAAETAAISPDGRFVAAIDDRGSARLWSDGGTGTGIRLGQAVGVVFSPDSELVASVADDGGAGIWRSATGSLLAALPGFGSLGGGNARFTSWSPGAAFTADASLVALANADGNVRIWDVAARKPLGAVAAGWVNALAFAPHGRMLAAMTWDGDLVVARSPPGIPLRTHFRPNSCDPDFEPVIADDGAHVLARTGGGAGVWTVAGDRVATLAPSARPAFLSSSVGSAVFSGDGATIAAATAPNGCVRSRRERHATGVWRLGHRPPVRELGARAPVMLGARGALLAVGGDVWRSDGGGPLPGLGRVLALSPTGGRALSLRRGALEVVDTLSGRTVATLREAGSLVTEAREFGSLDASFSPDGTRLLTSWYRNARLWDATSGEPIAYLGRNGEEIDRFAFGDGGRLVLATSPRRAWALSATDGEPVSSVQGPFAGGGLSQDGTLAAAPQADGALDVVDLATGTRTALQSDTGVLLTSVSFGPTADVILARDANGDVHVVSCEICAPEDELLELARSRLATLSRIEPNRPPFVAVA